MRGGEETAGGGAEESQDPEEERQEEERSQEQPQLNSILPNSARLCITCEPFLKLCVTKQ